MSKPVKIRKGSMAAHFWPDKKYFRITFDNPRHPGKAPCYQHDSYHHDCSDCREMNSEAKP